MQERGVQELALEVRGKEIEIIRGKEMEITGALLKRLFENTIAASQSILWKRTMCEVG